MQSVTTSNLNRIIICSFRLEEDSVIRCGPTASFRANVGQNLSGVLFFSRLRARVSVRLSVCVERREKVKALRLLISALVRLLYPCRCTL